MRDRFVHHRHHSPAGRGFAGVAVSACLFGGVLRFVLFFSLRPGKITLWIGKIINPLFLFFFAVLIIAALLSPGAAISSVEPTEAYQNGSFFPALIEGYGTMDAIAGLAFGIVVIDVIRRMGVNNATSSPRTCSPPAFLPVR